jgi:hypothetical protein
MKSKLAAKIDREAQKCRRPWPRERTEKPSGLKKPRRNVRSQSLAEQNTTSIEPQKGMGP